MLLSVIIPTYNRVNLIKFTLDSLSKQYHSNIDMEIIVVDDGSNDGTWDFITKDYPHVILIRNESKGAGSARNSGLHIAQGKYIVYLDSDDLAGAHFFDKKLEYLKQNAGIDACYGAYDFFCSDGAFSPDKIIFKHKYPLIEQADSNTEHLVNYLSGNFLPQNSIIWRKNFLMKCNGHDTTLLINQDVDLFIRAIFNNLKITRINDNTKVYIRSHSLDNRVGNAANDKSKWTQILDLRKRIAKDLKIYGYDDLVYYRAISNYIFGQWKKLRHIQPEIAGKYLEFSKELYWPVAIKGQLLYRLWSKIFGPVNAVNMKFFLLKRD